MLYNQTTYQDSNNQLSWDFGGDVGARQTKANNGLLLNSMNLGDVRTAKIKVLNIDKIDSRTNEPYRTKTGTTYVNLRLYAVDGNGNDGIFYCYLFCGAAKAFIKSMGVELVGTVVPDLTKFLKEPYCNGNAEIKKSNYNGNDKLEVAKWLPAASLAPMSTVFGSATITNFNGNVNDNPLATKAELEADNIPF